MASNADEMYRHRVATTRDVNPLILHPLIRSKIQSLQSRLLRDFQEQKTRTRFRLFEGYRHPARQTYLYNQRPKVTQAEAWESAHNFGLAADFVAQDGDGIWRWDEGEDWPHLKATAERFGLAVPISWDKPHVEWPRWPEFRKTLK